MPILPTLGQKRAVAGAQGVASPVPQTTLAPLATQVTPTIRPAAAGVNAGELGRPWNNVFGGK